MAGVSLFDRNDGHAVAATFRRQIEIDDLRKLLLQDRHEHLVQRHAQHGGLVGRLAGVGGVVDGAMPVGQPLDAKHRKPVLLVVVAGMVTKRPLQRMQVAAHFLDRYPVRAAAFEAGLGQGHMAFQHDFGRGWHLKLRARLTDTAIDQLGGTAAQQARKLVFGQRVGHRGDGAQHRRRVGPQRHGHRERHARIGPREVPKIQRATAVRQPAHDHLARADHLLAVDADVLPQPGPLNALWPPGDHQAPGDQRPGVVGPACLDGPARQIHLVTRQLHFAASAIAPSHRLHVPDRLDHLHQPAGVLDAARRLWLFQPCQQVADVSQLGHVGGTHAQSHPARRAKQIGQHGGGVPGGLLKPQRRPACAQHPVCQRSHFQLR